MCSCDEIFCFHVPTLVRACSCCFVHCRLAPLASCNARVLCAVEIHVLEVLDWAPLTLWDDALHSKGIRFGK